MIDYNNKCIQQQRLLQPERYIKELGANVSGNQLAQEQLQREAEWNGTNALDALPEELRLRYVAAVDEQTFTLTQDVLDMLQ